MGSVEVGLCLRPHPGHSVSGDAVLERHCDGGLLFGVVDAMGHGVRAAGVARMASRAFYESGMRRPAAIVEELHDELVDSSSSGCVCGIGFLDFATGRLEYASVGDVSCRVLGTRHVFLNGSQGTVGMRYRYAQEHNVVLEPTSLVVLHSDGVSARKVSALGRPALFASAQRAAETVVQMCSQGTDDASCLVIRYRGSE